MLHCPNFYAMIYQCLGIDHPITDHYSCYLDLNEQQNKLCLNKGGLSTPEKPKRSKISNNLC
ncbi:hypothetical protein [uncultured Gammaproteobacteria bacterium]|nr:hypothetical protein [uncultured Gammaproteobacteria bacterium]CAC9512669.1 hypothetical protein [uncultured Gammaproteobacteria bacterium]